MEDINLIPLNNQYSVMLYDQLTISEVGNVSLHLNTGFLIPCPTLFLATIFLFNLLPTQSY